MQKTPTRIKKTVVLFTVFWGITISSFCQTFRIDTLFVSNENGPHAYIPKCISLNPEFNYIANAINNSILEVYGFEDFEVENPEFLYYSNTELYHEIVDTILYLHIQGESWGFAHPSYNSVELFICLNSGNNLEDFEIPDLHTLFVSDSLHQAFIDLLWNTNECEIQRKKATECANFEPSCECNNLLYFWDSVSFTTYLHTDCYPHVVQGCTPYYEQTYTHAQLLPYFNQLGIQLLSSKYYMLHAVEQYYLRRNWHNTIINQ